MKNLSAFSLVLIFFIFSGCSENKSSVQISEGEISNGIYRYNELGWEFPVPEGWPIISKEEIKMLEAKGKKGD